MHVCVNVCDVCVHVMCLCIYVYVCTCVCCVCACVCVYIHVLLCVEGCLPVCVCKGCSPLSPHSPLYNGTTYWLFSVTPRWRGANWSFCWELVILSLHFHAEKCLNLGHSEPLKTGNPGVFFFFHCLDWQQAKWKSMNHFHVTSHPVIIHFEMSSSSWLRFYYQI